MSKILLRGITLGIILLLTCSLHSFAQQATTSLRGTVTDPNGAVIVGASVKLENKVRGFRAEATTGADGVYEFAQLPPATYELTISAQGFKTVVQPQVALQVATPATVNSKLPISTVAETVTVSGASAPAVNTSDATIGNPFNSRQILAIPSEGRNAVELLSLQPGVSYVGNEVDTGADSRGGAVNGARSDQTNITVDGLDNNDQLLGNAFTGALRVSMDSLEEFRVTTTNSNADSGRSSGAQVSLVTKSGTNEFHGSAYAYNRSLIGVANDWFNKHSQLLNNLPNRPGKLIRNTFGASVGGPIRKDRLFFFANFEGQRSRESVQLTEDVPSANLRQGIVSYECNPSVDPKCAAGTLGVSPTPLADGNLLVTLQPADIQTLDQGCIAHGTCPVGNGVSQAVLNLWNGGFTLPNGKAVPAYPSPNTAFGPNGDGVNIQGFTFAAPRPVNQNTYLVKLDYNLTQNGNHRLFARGNLQNDRTLDAPQFPGLPPSQVLNDNSKGIALGYTAVLNSSHINSFRYGFVRQGLGQDGPNPFSNVGFTGLSDQVSFLRTINVNVPVHQFVEDFTWTRGKHTFQFGGNWRIIHNNRLSNAQNFIFASPHPVFLAHSGIAGSGQDLDPARNPAFALVDPTFAVSYDAAIADVTGIFGSIDAIYNQLKSGPLPIGALVPRHFKANELEFYGQDTWRVAPNLTVTYGLRYTLLQPPYETHGNQVTTFPSISSFFDNRVAAMNAGQTFRPVISFGLTGQANGKNPYWAWDYKDLAPRFAIAYSPKFQSGILNRLFGSSGKTSIRAGYGMYYDHFGQGIVNSFDRQGSLGLATFLENPASISTTDCVARFISLTNIPTGPGCPAVPGGPPVPELPPQPAPGFPFTPPGGHANGAFAIGYTVDDKLKTPYAHVLDLSITRELPHQFVLELAYVGRLGHRLLQEIDLAQPLNIRDPQSGMTYYQAAAQLARFARDNTPINNIPNIPFWTNLFPGAAGPGLFSCSDTSGNVIPCAPTTASGPPLTPTATQNIYDLYFTNFTNEINALVALDNQCFPACSTLGPFAFFDDQLSSAYAWRSTGHSSYHAMQAMLRRHVGSMQFDFNYTYSKSIDLNSNAERVSEYENGSAAGVAFSGQVTDAFNPFGLRAVSDFDTTHQFNANWVYDLPLGHGHRWGGSASKFVDAMLGGWEFSGLYRWTSGYPFSITTGRFPTNFQQDSKAIVIGNAPRTGTFTDAQGDPNVFQGGPAVGNTSFRFPFPGEPGQRNNFRGPGYLGIDMSLAKLWQIRESKSLRFAWDVFNVTNSVRFDVGSLSNILANQPSLGKFTQTLTKPRVMQFGLRFSF
jgi:carboxypeptidase family protein